MVAKMALTQQSRTVLAWGSALGAIIASLIYFGFFPMMFTRLGSALTFIVLGLVLVFESIAEEAQRRGVKAIEVLKEMHPMNALAITLALFSFMLAMVVLLGYKLPETFKGVAGILLLVQGILLIVERYR